MKIWRCMVCGCEQAGEKAPKECPVCGVGPQEFTLKNADEAITEAGKSWKCTVCDFIHTGNQPPNRCPLCGVGREGFILLEQKTVDFGGQMLQEATPATLRAALNKVSYGLYVVSSIQGASYNGMCANTVFQLTDNPPRIAVCIHKNNLTHDYIVYSGVFTVSILGREHMAAVSNFGYRSGRSADKFAEAGFFPAQNGCPVLRGCIAYLEAKILPDKTTDVGTHSLFVADVTSGMVAQNQEELTYAYYRQNRI